MRLASCIVHGHPAYGSVTDDGVIDLSGRIGDEWPDLRSLIAGGAIGHAAAYSDCVRDHDFAHVTWLPVIPNPDKIVCIGINYEDHRVETANTQAPYPAIFLRTAESHTGHRSPIIRPFESHTLDYEAEIAVIVGNEGRRIPRDRAWDYIAGYSCYNDGSVREFQCHTTQYTAGKNFPRTGAFGPWMVTADEIQPHTPLTLSCRLNGELVQQATTEQMIFDFPAIIEYV